MSSSYIYRLYIILNILSIVCITLSNPSIDNQTIQHASRDGAELHYSKLRTASSVAGGLLLATTNEPQLNLWDPIDRKLLDALSRNSPELRASRDSRDFTDIKVEVSKRAWALLHERTRLVIRDRLRLAEPTLKEVLTSANVSVGCMSSLDKVLEGAMKMEAWAVRMVTAWGDFPPNGLFEGTYSEIGSYHSCVNIPKNEFIDHAHYCTLNFRPVMPSRQKYQLIVSKQPRELLSAFEYTNTSTSDLPLLSNRSEDAFRDFLDQAEYLHFVYFKIGSCWPIECSPFDIRRVSRLVAKRNVLMNGPVKCFSKYSDDYEEPGSIETRLANGSEPIKRKLSISVWDRNEGIFISKPHFHNGQKAALLVVGSIALLIFSMTLIDILINRLPALLGALQHSLKSSRQSPMKRNPSNGSPEINQPPANSYKDEDSAMKVINSVQAVKTGSTPGDLPLAASHRAYLPVATCDQANQRDSNTEVHRAKFITHDDKSAFMTMVEYCSIVTSCNEFLNVTEAQSRNIVCLDGIRCITMAWIILTHSMMYNDWSAFGRTREVEKAVTSLITQPIFSASYLVDSFFLMSGLLSSYTAFRHCKGMASKFHSFAYILNRWLRLTPQVFFVSMLFIIWPALSDGPHWYPMTGEYSENCVDNWWINTLHLQAFYKTETMCNFVTWWISIDFFYHFFAVIIIWAILLAGDISGFLSVAAIVCGHVTWQTIRHYQQSLPPNVLSTIPQAGPMWTEMVQGFYWQPYSHSVPFFLGFYLGYLMALKKKPINKWLNPKRALIGWSMAATCFFVTSFSPYWWITGKAEYSRLVSTTYHVVCPMIWAVSLCWIILACHHGYGGPVNSFLTNRAFVILGRASFLVYLSHFQIMFLFFGNQNILVEPTTIVMLYIILGNIIVSTCYGTFLCIVFELPWLKAQKKLVQYL